jgi:archaellum biogenesis ATPase FlaH
VLCRLGGEVNLLESALRYARADWPVFPCEPKGKKPLCEHGLKDATTDEKTIRAWWTKWPDANIGHPTGQWMVLDVDGEEGERSLAELEAKHGKLPATTTAKTGKGRHFYFQPNGSEVRNSAGKLGLHLDSRGKGGYVILPPSVHESGTRYQWTVKAKPAPLPAWIMEKLAEPERPHAIDSSGKVVEGRRNAHLTSLAGAMRRKGMTPAAIEAALLRENELCCDPPLPGGEIQGIAASVGRYDPAQDGGLHLAKLRIFSAIIPERLRWLWRGRIPIGKYTLIAGDPGLGKSLLTVDIAARVSTGTPFPDGTPCERGNVIFLSAEDDPADTIRPRLDAADADVSRVHLLEAVRNFTSDGKSAESGFNLERDMNALEDAIRQTGARVVFIDPVSAYLGGTDSHTNAEVRELLSPLAALASKYEVAIVAVTHLRKSSGAAIYRAMGSVAFAAAARAVWGVVADLDDKARRLFIPVKQNLAPDLDGLAYRIEATDGIAKISWESGAVAVDVNAVMGGFETREDHSERREAEEWLRDFLAEGPRTANDVRNQSHSATLTWITVRRAAGSLGITKRKMGGRGAGWEWSLQSKSEDAQPEDAHPRHSEVSTFDEVVENTTPNGQPEVKDAHVSIPEPLWRASAFEEGEI